MGHHLGVLATALNPTQHRMGAQSETLWKESPPTGPGSGSAAQLQQIDHEPSPRRHATLRKE